MNKKLIILATASLCFVYLFSRYFSPVTNTQASELKKTHNNELVSKTTDSNKTLKSIENETSHSEPINYCTKTLQSVLCTQSFSEAYYTMSLCYSNVISLPCMTCNQA